MSPCVVLPLKTIIFGTNPFDAKAFVRVVTKDHRPFVLPKQLYPRGPVPLRETKALPLTAIRMVFVGNSGTSHHRCHSRSRLFEAGGSEVEAGGSFVEEEDAEVEGVASMDPWKEAWAPIMGRLVDRKIVSVVAVRRGGAFEAGDVGDPLEEVEEELFPLMVVVRASCLTMLEVATFIIEAAVILPSRDRSTYTGIVFRDLGLPPYLLVKETGV